MWIHEALDAVVETLELRGTARADLLDRGQLVDALSLPENRHQQIFILRICRDASPARGIERIDDGATRLAAELIEDHVGVIEAAHLEHSRIGGLDGLFRDLDPILPLLSARSDGRQFVHAA